MRFFTLFPLQSKSISITTMSDALWNDSKISSTWLKTWNFHSFLFEISLIIMILTPPTRHTLAMFWVSRRQLLLVINSSNIFGYRAYRAYSSMKRVYICCARSTIWVEFLPCGHVSVFQKQARSTNMRNQLVSTQQIGYKYS